MRISRAASGIIKHCFLGEDSYLLQINRGWKNRYNFIGGHLEPGDGNDYKKTMIRELEEELPPLKYQVQFEVESISLQPFQQVAHSLSSGQDTEYTIYIFHIRFLVPLHEISFLWENDPSVNCWFTKEELLKGVGKKGERITRFPVPQIIEFIPGGLEALPDSFILKNSSEAKYAIC